MACFVVGFISLKSSLVVKDTCTKLYVMISKS
ncbi:unnamed protein product [Spirodela intermedia]|uniref:Uncharacterized protein n=2 Tax=Spirodela intermedia TaxID=51605 RepID=A0A7I8I7D2_SPIIN|nr:unnamed protein product [Spirodela intermedia]CAA6653450.1 unnamed protein product [Spirodela intermedia]CAA7387675.1 unnamed protein product [Spirodela intermedia]